MPVIQKVMVEQGQTHETRKTLFVDLEKLLGRPVITYFTSFHFPVQIENGDADMIEGILQKMDLSKGLALCINSPGGDGMAAERIINLCRTYSGTEEYWAIVPSKAKSAATMVCLGASKIIMGPTSELGPVDPQLVLYDQVQKKLNRFNIYNLIKSYEDLFSKAVTAKGNLEPFLQQLANYDSREIEEYRAAMALSEDIAIRALHTGMLDSLSQKEIKKKIEIFLSPKQTKDHGRPIYGPEAKHCGLAIESPKPGDKLWEMVYNLYIRTDSYTAHHAAKCIESKAHSFAARPPTKKE